MAAVLVVAADDTSGELGWCVAADESLVNDDAVDRTGDWSCCGCCEFAANNGGSIGAFAGDCIFMAAIVASSDMLTYVGCSWGCSKIQHVPPH